MLVSQAAYAVEKFTGGSISADKTEEVYREILRDKKNIVLIGMPGCGKTTIGKISADRLHKEFIDTDDEIIKRINMPIADYFAKHGEESFRRLESEVIKEISACRSSVIATGGGAVLNPDNIRLLKENGTVIFIDRPLEKLVTTADRPLSSNKELLEKRFKERYGLYCAAADVKIDAVSRIEQNVKNIEEVFLNENSCN